MSNKLPKISYCVFTYNEEKNIEGSLTSIFNQDYPKDRLEVIVVDDHSTDRTLEIVKKFPVKIFHNGKRDGDLSATIGFNNATGDFYTAVGADMQFRGRDWFRQMIKPLMENPDMPAAFTIYYSHPKDSLITKYLNLDPIQRDLIYQTFSIGFDQVEKEKKNGYYICHYSPDKIPPQTHGLYRVSTMRKIIEKQKIYYDMGNLILLVKAGYTRFGYVPSAGYYHFHADNLMHLLKKRMRNIERSYLRYGTQVSTKESQFKWIDLSSFKDILKIIFLIVSANLFIPIFLLSLYKSIRHRSWLYLLEAPITLALVDTILFTFLKDPRGRGLMKDNFIKLLSKIIDRDTTT